jgi:hypothetical protein
MDLSDLTRSDILTLFSIILTIISIPFGIWGIYVTAYRVKYPGRLTYTPIKTVNIYDSIIKSFPDFSIKHDGVDIENELVYHRSAVSNTGKIDIKKDMIEEPIKIFLENGQWKEARIKNSPSIKSSITIGLDKKSLHLETGLLRIDEALQYEALATLDNVTDELPLIDHIKVTHRISDIDAIDKSERMPIERIRNNIRQHETTKKMLYLILAIGLLMPIIMLITQPSTVITIALPNLKSIYSLSEVKENVVEFSDLNSFISHNSLPADSSSLSKIIYKPTKLNYFQKSRIFSAAYLIPIVTILYVSGLALFFNRNRKRFLKLEKTFILTSD